MSVSPCAWERQARRGVEVTLHCNCIRTSYIRSRCCVLCVLCAACSPSTPVSMELVSRPSLKVADVRARRLMRSGSNHQRQKPYTSQQQAAGGRQGASCSGRRAVTSGTEQLQAGAEQLTRTHARTRSQTHCNAMHAYCNARCLLTTSSPAAWLAASSASMK